ncbi:hypothetical protein AJ85_20085 [Alkalihalobacillus alcalophilus ATCC 27647 = CGMCC 1.3604]|uniref:Uncharacterized protein n=1 Tax=Alkalihalobacillus alcalophilus ATCC 27647 = CGMCC 1.3604 TaxID=1218173 RepID=A0A094XAJ6_ALKAL|nr:hypothetical protein [Alkalihalobacillus alcalophilus]KGA95785.1 hypothetical protein BALCAV_0220255 [Alkalihalobacillus alcalophilus ATCC 27647 = CGMCC 1.3604]MED1561191.1 hypothetical protein [Alkalihalobacillus alcalophilus]THG89002.1 hypothetical protein AJ85_20085 [Alkalihalobacillus alcalophilus ATCC 27647 = CGMCC 1.3604]
MERVSELNEKKLLHLLEYVRTSAQEETKLEVAECMLDYGIDIQLIGAVTGLKRDEIIKKI